MTIFTVVSADSYQLYIPLFLMCVRLWAGEDVDVRIYIRGEISSLVSGCLDMLKSFGLTSRADVVIGNVYPKAPTGISSTNSLRFLLSHEALELSDYTLITDIDLLLFQDPFPWHIQGMRESGLPYHGHRGPKKRPFRPEIAPMWTGDFERVAGGFFCVTPQWYKITKEQREYQLDELYRGHIGWWRESDEVMLARIIKGSGLKMPESKDFPVELRGVHLGDARIPERINDMGKMSRKLTTANARKYVEIQREPIWKAMVDILTQDKHIADVLSNMNNHLKQRGLM